MPHSFRKNLFRLKRRDALLLGTALFVAVAIFDWATANALSLSAFYLFPILLVAWNCGRGWGLVFAVAAVTAAVAQGSLLEPRHNKPIQVYIAHASVLLEYVIAVLLTAILRKLYNQERLTARIDALTGARNRKGFQEALANEIARHERKGITFCLAYIDCDNFKQVNDNHGHAEGDRVLKAISDVAIDTLRRSDTVGRIGGDEFAVILPETGRTEALFVVDKLQHKLRAVTRVRQWGVSFSIGVAVFDKSPGAAIAAMEFADRLMYTAKRSSKGLTVWNSFGDPARTATVWEVGTIGASDITPVSEPSPRA
jgi:diguanylate cyclase (GGDEF)-like protein